MASRLLRFLGAGWLALLAVVLLVSAFAHVRAAASFWGGVGEVLYWFNPFNIAGFIVNVLSLAPAFIAFWAAERLDQRRARVSQEPG